MATQRTLISDLDPRTKKRIRRASDWTHRHRGQALKLVLDKLVRRERAEAPTRSDEPTRAELAAALQDVPADAPVPEPLRAAIDRALRDLPRTTGPKGARTDFAIEVDVLLVFLTALAFAQAEHEREGTAETRAVRTRAITVTAGIFRMSPRRVQEIVADASAPLPFPPE